jgi:outer membrane protein OmpA-like peptidoglycan-associated protein
MLASTRSSAQTATPLDRFDPAPAGDAFFTVPSADVTQKLAVNAALLATIARSPLVLGRATGSDVTSEVVKHQLLLHVLGSVQLGARVAVDLDAPFTLSQASDGAFASTIGSAAVDDLRFGARVALMHQKGDLPAVAAAFSVWVPTGAQSSFGGGGSARWAPRLLLSAEYEHIAYSLELARRFQSADQSLIGSDTVIAGALGARFGHAQVGPEFYVSIPSLESDRFVVRGGNGAEIYLTGRYAIGDLSLGAGAGPGIGRAVGIPSFRAFLTAAYAFGGRAKPIDQAPSDDANSPKNIAPIAVIPKVELPADRDGDGVVDTEDACPDVAGDASISAEKRGCPPDRDHDGVVDAEDACVDVPGARAVDPKKNGCPVDSDGDGIFDDKDACPTERGIPSEDPKKNGCPEAVRVEGTQIVILQQVNFETGKDIIKADSFGLLQQVADVLNGHKDIARVAVDGHTDNRGGDKPNLSLSQRRAVAVERWLTSHGVDARRLEARGFGQRRPIADNATDAGRAKNRRVEFQILRRTEQGEAGWVDGPLP